MIKVVIEITRDSDGYQNCTARCTINDNLIITDSVLTKDRAFSDLVDLVVEHEGVFLLEEEFTVIHE